MMTYYLKYKKDTENIDLKMMKNKNDRLILSSKCAICHNKNQDL